MAFLLSKQLLVRWFGRKDEKLIRVYLPNEKINKSRATPLLKKRQELQQYLCGELEVYPAFGINR